MENCRTIVCVCVCASAGPCLCVYSLNNLLCISHQDPNTYHTFSFRNLFHHTTIPSTQDPCCSPMNRFECWYQTRFYYHHTGLNGWMLFQWIGVWNSTRIAVHHQRFQFSFSYIAEQTSCQNWNTCRTDQVKYRKVSCSPNSNIGSFSNSVFFFQILIWDTFLNLS